jgi:hypothetical protein
METNYLLYTLPQWTIFAGITVIIYGIAEDKEVFERVGLVILALLGFFSAYVLASHLLLSDKFMSPAEYALPEEMVTEDDLSVEGKLIPAYWGIMLMALLAIVSLVLKILKKKRARLIMYFAVGVAVGTFFLILAAIKK